LTKLNLRKKAYGLIVETKKKKNKLPRKENKIIEEKDLNGEFARLSRKKVY